VHTEFNLVARRNPNRRDNSGPEAIHVSIEEVVRAGLHAIEHDKPLVVPGVMMKISMLLVRLTPMWVLRLASRGSL
jgi:short-subunit dehydrogenase